MHRCFKLTLNRKQSTAFAAGRDAELRVRLAQSEAQRISAAQEHESLLAELRREYGTLVRYV